MNLNLMKKKINYQFKLILIAKDMLQERFMLELNQIIHKYNKIYNNKFHNVINKSIYIITEKLILMVNK